MNKRQPVYRTCIVSRELLLQKDLFRLVKVNNEVVLDKKQNLPGRGAYIKKELSVIIIAQKRKALNKAFKTDVKDDVYILLIQELSKKERDR